MNAKTAKKENVKNKRDLSIEKRKTKPINK